MTKINGQLIEDAQDLDVVMPLYNLFIHSKNYQKTAGSLFNYCRDGRNSGSEGDIDYSIKDSKSFDYKTGLVSKLEGNNTELKNIKIALHVKYLGRFFKLLCIYLINCELSLDVKWSKNCVLTSKVYREADDDANPPVVGINNPTNAEFSITDCKLYVPVVTLPTEYENKLFKMLQ